MITIIVVGWLLLQIIGFAQHNVAHSRNTSRNIDRSDHFEFSLKRVAASGSTMLPTDMHGTTFFKIQNVIFHDKAYTNVDLDM